MAWSSAHRPYALGSSSSLCSPLHHDLNSCHDKKNHQLHRPLSLMMSDQTWRLPKAPALSHHSSLLTWAGWAVADCHFYVGYDFWCLSDFVVPAFSEQSPAFWPRRGSLQCLVSHRLITCLVPLRHLYQSSAFAIPERDRKRKLPGSVPLLGSRFGVRVTS